MVQTVKNKSSDVGRMGRGSSSFGSLWVLGRFRGVVSRVAYVFSIISVDPKVLFLECYNGSAHSNFPPLDLLVIPFFSEQVWIDRPNFGFS